MKPTQKKIAIIAAVLIILFLIYWFFFKKKGTESGYTTKVTGAGAPIPSCGALGWCCTKSQQVDDGQGHIIAQCIKWGCCSGKKSKDI